MATKAVQDLAVWLQSAVVDGTPTGEAPLFSIALLAECNYYEDERESDYFFTPFQLNLSGYTMRTHQPSRSAEQSKKL
ncbi:hypothetical protein MPDQ_002595 [Monascus purpureus]|uniref:Uncharacterized protein n=1 Tax=Monascus purpureus TaxID=5098 RepID=A0A507QP97_MONPU|nr:hypothetical protein MPDQ_002595 [Monascus purpureus]